MSLDLYRETDGRLQLVGTAGADPRAAFTYAPAYLGSPAAQPLSLSLPLQAEPFAEEQAAPYLRGLLPEGQALAALAQELGAREEDYLAILGSCGLDCIGDVIVNPRAYQEERSYCPIDLKGLGGLAAGPALAARALEASRLSLAGTQSKCGLFHDPSAAAGEGWYAPSGGAPSNFIVKQSSQLIPRVLMVERLSMGCAERCGLRVPRAWLFDFGSYVIAVERFDRGELSSELIGGLPVPLRRHQEDFAQLFGVLPGSKYAELQGGSLAAIANLLRRRSSRPAEDLEQLARIVLFNYLIGNCDNHLKNLSVLYAPDWRSLRLAPAYDLVCTTMFERFSRNMGMALGGERNIDAVRADHLQALARELGVRPRLLKAVAAELAAECVPALRELGERLGDEGDAAPLPEAPYVADDIEEDVAPRLGVLRDFAG